MYCTVHVLYRVYCKFTAVEKYDLVNLRTVRNLVAFCK